MVDLGGFPNYVHQHDPGREVVLQFETRLARNLMPELHGVAKEQEPLREFSRFGLALHLGFPPANPSPEGTPRKPLVRTAEILIDGSPALTLSPEGPLLSAQSMNHPLLTGALRTVFEWSLSKEGKGSPEANLAARFERREQELESTAQLRSLLLADNTARATQGTHTSPDMLKDQPSPATRGRALESEFGRLQQVFSKVLACSSFLLHHLILVDVSPYAQMDQAGILDRPERADDDDGSLTEFFEQHGHWDDEEWLAEAQAVRHNLSKVLGFCTGKIAAALRTVSYLGPMRFVPPRHFTPMGISDPRLVAGGSLAWELLCQNPKIVRGVNKWLSPERLGTPYRLKARQLLDADRVGEAIREGGSAVQRLKDSADVTELVFEDTRSKTILSHRDVGFGVGQVVPILVNAFALKERFIAIEQPELHLHPAQQAELGDVFIESALGERKNTFLLETHSEHLILRVMRRIRETTRGRLAPGAIPVRPSDVAVLYVERDGDHSIVREMPLNDQGELVKAWPGGFFEEGYRELFS